MKYLSSFIYKIVFFYFNYIIIYACFPRQIWCFIVFSFFFIILGRVKVKGVEEVESSHFQVLCFHDNSKDLCRKVQTTKLKPPNSSYKTKYFLLLATYMLLSFHVAHFLSPPLLTITSQLMLSCHPVSSTSSLVHFHPCLVDFLSFPLTLYTLSS